jgi:hypothetical protein
MLERPDFTEIKMDAEIGSYQEDYGPIEDAPIAERTEGDSQVSTS